MGLLRGGRPASPAGSEEPLLNAQDNSRRSSRDEEAVKLPNSSRTARKRLTILTCLLAASIAAVGVVVYFLASHKLFPKTPSTRPHRPQLDSPIKNVVVLVQENLSFDAIAGGLAYNPDIDNLVNRTFCNPANISDPNSPQVCAKSVAKNVAPDDPDHSIAGGNFQVYGTDHPDLSVDRPTMQGFVTEQIRSYGINGDLARASEVINYYAPEHIPIFNTLAENYILFDRWFAAVPGPTNPNRAYMTSGTSHGHGWNDPGFDVSALPQLSIFEQLSAANISWINYSNATGFSPDALFYTWTAKNAKSHIQYIDQFYADAASGTLPQFTWINPECCTYQSFHPPSPTNIGEDFIKSIYEALRSSPQWNETLFILTFDEHGGFADHVPPPENVPAGDEIVYTEVAKDGRATTFHFDRLGIRVPTLLISPWVGKGVVEHAPASDSDSGVGRKGEEYTHTSILKYVADLWGLEYLGPRVEWSASFGGLVREEFRGDTPVRLPESVVF